MVLTRFKALTGPLYDLTFKAFVRLIELNVVPDFIVRAGVRALLQTRLDMVRRTISRNWAYATIVNACCSACGPPLLIATSIRRCEHDRNWVDACVYRTLRSTYACRCICV